MTPTKFQVIIFTNVEKTHTPPNQGSTGGGLLMPFIRTEIGKDKILRQWPVLQSNAKFIKLWDENVKNSELQCKALGPQNCLAIPIEDWQNGKQSIYDFILS